MLRKAARGAGWTWGYAEELGASVRALEASRLPGIALGASLLTQADLEHCPIRLAARAADTGELPAEPVLLRCPLLSLPVLAGSFCRADDAISIAWPGGTASATDFDRVHCDADDLAIDSQPVPVNFTRLRSHSAPVAEPARNAITAADSDWQTLERFALGSYVPASEQSRLGAGPTD